MGRSSALQTSGPAVWVMKVFPGLCEAPLRVGQSSSEPQHPDISSELQPMCFMMSHAFPVELISTASPQRHPWLLLCEKAQEKCHHHKAQLAPALARCPQDCPRSRYARPNVSMTQMSCPSAHFPGVHSLVSIAQVPTVQMLASQIPTSQVSMA